MGRLLTNLPFLVLTAWVFALAMIVPALFAATLGDWRDARSFLNTAILTLMLSSLIAVATANRPRPNQGRMDLFVLLAAFALLPVLMAFPFYEAVQNTRFINAYTEMVSSFTTTGATLFDPDRLTPALQLWRAMCAWLGGLLMWTAAAAVFAPLTLGGYEVGQRVTVGRDFYGRVLGVPLTQRMTQALVRLAPLYTALTATLWIALAVAGTPPLAAVVAAMSTLSTSGITLDGAPGAGRLSEAFILVFLIFALSRASFDRGVLPTQSKSAAQDPEFRLGFALIAVVTVLLFLRQFFGAVAVGEGTDLSEALQATWGALFTAASFLSTAGFISDDWLGAQDWSGLPTPGLILIALALLGGGVATTAGGVKLLRTYALIKHGQRELDRLIHPSSVGGSGRQGRHIRREGAYIAWVFFMLFGVTMAVVMIGFAAAGLSFDEALVLAAACLSNTGPLTIIATDTPLDLIAISDPAKALMCLAMVLGRLETLALLALLNPDFWRA